MCGRSGANLGSQGAAAKAAVFGQDGALVVPAEVAFGRADLLALLLAGQSVGAVRAEIVTSLANP